MSHIIHKSARDFALRHKINLGRKDTGFYYIAHYPAATGPAVIVDHSFQPSAKSALAMMRRYLRNHK